MAGTLPHIRIVAALIEEEGRYLITQRQSSACFPGLWEFPSGKVEDGELDESALQRELRERLGIAVIVGRLSAARSYSYEAYAVDSVVYRAKIAAGHKPRPLRVADLRWVTAAEIEGYAFPPADQAAMDRLLEFAHDERATEAPLEEASGARREVAGQQPPADKRRAAAG